MRTQSSCTEKCLLGDERSNGKAYKKDEFVVEFLWWHVIKLISLDGIPLGNFPTESIDHESLSLLANLCVCNAVRSFLYCHIDKEFAPNATTEKFFRFFMFYPHQIDYSFSVIAVVVVVFFCHHHHHHHHQKSTPSVPKQISL